MPADDALPSIPYDADRGTFDLTVEQLDALPVGVITLDRRGTVLRYNRTEAAYARRTIDTTLHRNFFTEIAPCTRVREFLGRFERFAAENADGFERFDFTFPFRWGRRDVEIVFSRRLDVEPIDIIVTTRHRSSLELDDASHLEVREPPRATPTDAVRLAIAEAEWHDDLVRGTSVWSPEMYRLADVDRAHSAAPGGLRAFAHPDDARTLDAFVRAAIEARAPYGFEHRIVTADGAERFVAIRASVTYDAAGRATAVDGRASDITARRTAERDLWRDANFDRLTGLANRAQLEARFSTALETTSNIGRRLALAYVDLDRFKAINDTFGHVVGDEVLRLAARRLERCVRPGDLVARISGDEFVIFLDGFDDDVVVETVCERVLACFEGPMIVETKSLSVSASVGFAIAPDHGESIDDLLHAADAAMYESKAANAPLVVRCSDALQRAQRQRARLERDLADALEEGTLELEYQPIVGSTLHDVVAAEALIRWNHPTLGRLQPDDFIPLAESSGAILRIGAWAIETACKRIRRSIDNGDRVVLIAVNVSLVQFRSPELVETVRRAIERWRVPPNYLALELTESVGSGNFYETMRTLATLKTLGVKLAIDDFGTGYSSLAYLKHFPIDAVKLDRAFVADIVSDPLDRAIAETVVALARRLHFDIVAEGVETLAQARCMRDLGCDRLQGFLFGRPVTERAFFTQARRAPHERDL